MDLRELGLIIRKRRESKGLTQAQLALKVKIQPPSINRIENGKMQTTTGNILAIAEALDVLPYELFSKEALISKAQADKDPAIIEVFPDEAAKLDFNKFRTRDDFLPVRILEDAASLGHGAMISQERTRGYALIYKHALPRKAEKQKRAQEKIICLFVKGESMLPAIQDGSLVAIDVEDKNEIKNYKIYAVEIPDEGVTIKRVYRDKDNLVLLADNRDFRGFPRVVNLKGLSYNPVCGKVVWTWNRLD